MPKPGETLIGNKFEQGFGGKGANQCVSAARLGAKTVFITSVRSYLIQFLILLFKITIYLSFKLGSDSLGLDYLNKLKKENVDVSYVKLRENTHTGVAHISVSETGIVLMTFLNKFTSCSYKFISMFQA